MFSELVGRILRGGTRSEFERYYGNLLLARSQNGKPTLEEAKRDYLTFLLLSTRLA